MMLIAAGVLESGFAICLKLSDGLTRPAPSIAFFVLAATSFYMLTRAAMAVPLGTAYAVWTGIGAAGAVLGGAIVFDEPLTLARVILLSTLIGAIAGLKVIGARESRAATALAPAEPVLPSDRHSD